MRSLVLFFPMLVLLFAAPPLAAEEPSPPDLAPPRVDAGTDSAPPEPARALETTVRVRRPITAASSSTVRDRDFLLRPRARPADILSVVPGLFVAQHAGGGKANQYFLRGFDADHGADVLLMVDGVPVNMVSHGHGQGYADLNWLIPEIVDRVEVAKGPYFAEHGDLATAGAVDLITRRAPGESMVSLAGGSFQTGRALALLAPRLDGWRPFAALELYATDGPFTPGEALRRYSFFGKATHDLSPSSSLTVSAQSYAARWNASGQLPLRAVEAGTLDRFGAVDPTDGGDSQRHALSVSWRRVREESKALASAYLVLYHLALFSNFTFYSADPARGDQIEQNDDRIQAGFRLERSTSLSIAHRPLSLSYGLQGRVDRVDNALRHTEKRNRIEDLVVDRVLEGSVGTWTQGEVAIARWLRAVLGLRADLFGFGVANKLTGEPTRFAADGLLSPKASVILSPSDNLDLFANFGMGFHSNDARGVVREADPVTPLSRATGGELGARTMWFDRLDLGLALFAIALQSEIVWVGDEGVTEARGPTLRRGVELEARLKILDWLFADLDAMYNVGTYTANAGNADAVALAPTLMLQGGVSARHPAGWSARLGVVHLGDRPATEDRFLTARGFTRLDASVSYRRGPVELTLSAQNLLDTEWSEVQFANVSRLSGETACGPGTRPAEEDGAFLGCEDIHFTPGAPRAGQATLTLFF